MKNRILFVDDEQNLLDGIQRILFKQYDISTALSGDAGLKCIANNGPYAVVVSDMRMPVMDGVTFLAKVKEASPESIRIMLTGTTDLNTAIAAVNEGNIFRFVSKPCSKTTLENVLNAAIEQYHLIHAEKELLENTLQGGINVLVDILALTNPVAFCHAARIKYFVGELVRVLKLENSWQYKVAAMLSQIGCVTIPPDVLEKVYFETHLDPIEKDMLDQYPIIGHDLIAHIPRLEVIASMIAHQRRDLDDNDRSEAIEQMPKDVLGAAILRIAIDYDTLLSQGLTREAVIKKLIENEKRYHPTLLLNIHKVLPPVMEKRVTVTPIKNLFKGMILESDVMTKKGLLLAKKGQEVSHTMCVMFENHLKQKNIDETISVSILTPPKEFM